MTDTLGDAILPGTAEMNYFDGADVTNEFLTGGYEVDSSTGTGINRTTFDATNVAPINDDTAAILISYGYYASFFGLNTSISFNLSTYIGLPSDTLLQRVQHISVDGQPRHTHVSSGSFFVGVREDPDWCAVADNDEFWLPLEDQKFDYKAQVTDNNDMIKANDEPRFGFSIRAEITI